MGGEDRPCCKCRGSDRSAQVPIEGQILISDELESGLVDPKMDMLADHSTLGCTQTPVIW